MEDFDITEFAKMFDAALASDNPAVKKALRNFMMVAAIVHTPELDTAERNMGPFETLLKKVSDLERMYWDLKNTTITTSRDYRDYYNTNPTWVYNPTVYSGTYTTGSTSSKSYTSTYMGKEVDGAELYDLLKDLKIT
jgi:hypothetical protein